MTPEDIDARRAELQRQLSELPTDDAPAPEPEDTAFEEEVQTTGTFESGLSAAEIMTVVEKRLSTPEAIAAFEERRAAALATFKVHYVSKDKQGDPEQHEYCQRHGCLNRPDLPFHAFPYWWLKGREYSDASRWLESVVCWPSSGRWLDTDETSWERLCRLWKQVGIEVPDLNELREAAKPDYPASVLVDSHTTQGFGKPRTSREWES